MDYKTLYQEYLRLLEENKKLKKELQSIKFNQEQEQGDNLDNSADKSYISPWEQKIRESGIQESEPEPGETEPITPDYYIHAPSPSSPPSFYTSHLPSSPLSTLTYKSPSEDKIKCFEDLFIGRKDVYAKRWFNKKKGTAGYSPICYNEWKKGLCNKPKTKCAFCPNQNFDKFSRKAIEKHLKGQEVYGIYPLLKNDSCRLLAMDFDNEGWKDDVKVIRDICDKYEIPVAVERSRSGNGAHVWFFFEEEISASLARKMGTAILTKAMSKRHQLQFKSYDKLFPSQDSLPKGGFGNLIALPLQKEARKYHNTEFIDENFDPYLDQWKFLSQVQRLNLEQVKHIISKLAPEDEHGELRTSPWLRKKEKVKELSKADFPTEAKLVLADRIYLDKTGFSNPALNKTKRIAAFKNPEFFRAQAMRLSTFNKPRIIDLSDQDENYLFLPRGCFEELKRFLDSYGVHLLIQDERNDETSIEVEFNGELREDQQEAADTMLKYDNGVLSASTAFGKTVVGACLIAYRKRKTLVLLHNKQLLSQWKEQLKEFLYIKENLPAHQTGDDAQDNYAQDDKKNEQQKNRKKKGRKKKKELIGQVGGGKNRPSGIIDIALMQSLVKGDEVKDLIKDYDLVLVDECHHVPAFSFDKIMNNIFARYVYGLTATPIRKDGHDPIIFMQCGPTRKKIERLESSADSSVDYIVSPRFTSFTRDNNEDNFNIAGIYRDLVEDEARNSIIIEDVKKAVNEGKNPLVLSERTGHVDLLAENLKSQFDNVIKLTGKMKAKTRRQELDKLSNIPEGENFVLVATGKFIGEGFDEPGLDTLFLTVPVSWKGTISQYLGRLHRNLEDKKEVIVYDYVDINVPVLEKMYQKRLRAYKSQGYKSKESPGSETIDTIYDQDNFISIFKKDLSDATSKVILVSPIIEEDSLENILEIIKDNLNINNIVVLTQPETKIKEKYRKSHEIGLEKLENNSGVEVIYKAGLFQNFAVIDGNIVWYGSINLLSYKKSNGSIMRLNSNSIAGELLASVDL